MNEPQKSRSKAASKANTVAVQVLRNAIEKPADPIGKAGFRPNRAALKALADLEIPGLDRPKLIISGRCTMDGRSATLMRIRPTIWAELAEVEAVGTRQYLVVEAALRMFISHLKGIPDGETLLLDAEKMVATPEDFAMLEQMGRVVKKYPKRPAKTS